MVDTIMMYLAPLSFLLVGFAYLWAIYHSIKTRAWKQITVGILLGLVSAVVGGAGITPWIISFSRFFGLGQFI